MSDLNWNKSSFSSDSANCVEVAWCMSSFCHQGSCVEVGWTSSSLCAGGDCVEVKSDKAQILVRDSKLGDDSPVLRFGVVSWWVFTDAITTPPKDDLWKPVHRSIAYEGNDVILSTSVRSPQLRFNWGEWKAFVLGVRAGEFDPEKLSEGVSAGSGSVAGSGEAAAGTDVSWGGAVPVAAEPLTVHKLTYQVPVARGECEACGAEVAYNLAAHIVSHTTETECDSPTIGGYTPMSEKTLADLLALPEDSPAGWPVDVSTDEVDLSSAVQPGSDAAGTGVPPDPVPVAREFPVALLADASDTFHKALDDSGSLFEAVVALAEWAYQAGWNDREQWARAVAPLVPTDGVQ
jgi:hypothetical protein